jgi:hypothetical protein
MYGNNKVYGFDLNAFTSDEIIEKIGIDRLPNDQLLDVFIEVLDNINFAWRHETSFERDKVHQQAALFAYEAFKRFYKDKESPQKFSHPSLRDFEYLPNTIQYWSHPVATSILFEILVDDGYYTEKNYA